MKNGELDHGELIDAIINEASERGLALLFRNQTGLAKYLNKKTGKVSMVPYGVGPSKVKGRKRGGGLDLIGLRRKDGKFVAIDAKVGNDKLSENQKMFIRWVISAGGVAGEARSVEQAIAIIES